MKSRCRIHIELHDAGAAWGRFRTLTLSEDQQSPRLSAVSAHIGKSRAGEIARINGGGGWTVRGRAAKWLVEGVSWIVGGFVGETDWKGILHAPR